MAEGRVAGKTAIVTGGASGIGAAIAATLSVEGARVAISDMKEDAGAALVASLQGGVFIRHDVTIEA